MKKTLAALFALLMVLALTACGSGEGEETAETDADAIAIGDYTFTKVTDYLFETTMDSYGDNYEAAREYMSRYMPELGGCSAVENGKIRGRNYDWTYDEEPEFVIHVPANDEGRHASVGVAATTDTTAEAIENGEFCDTLDIIPYLTLDGINDAGLAVNINVVLFGEKGEFEMKTEDTSDDICPLMITRILLDNAGSIDEALALLEEMDVYSLGNQDEAHLMISGPQSAEDSTFNTVVVEFIPGENKHFELSVIDYNKGEFVDDQPVMTNFHLTDYDGTPESLTKHPMGLERYNALMENFDMGATPEGMMDLMKLAYYSRAYDIGTVPFWYSEFSEGDLVVSMKGDDDLQGDTANAGPFEDIINENLEKFEKGERDGTLWQTVHCSVYDIENFTLYVLPQETGVPYEFTL